MITKEQIREACIATGLKLKPNKSFHWDSSSKIYACCPVGVLYIHKFGTPSKTGVPDLDQFLFELNLFSVYKSEYIYAFADGFDNNKLEIDNEDENYKIIRQGYKDGQECRELLKEFGVEECQV